jgi:hypothetical protein
MKVFLLIVEDRHTDVDVKVFADGAAAMLAAKELVDDYDYEPDEPDDAVPEWLFNATLSCEGDCLRVQAVDVI